ncbi:MAG: nickel pincer cofactor biosynthesis protein LarB [Deltaproteobacteria bacterium]|nr:nickel pincer cofactor biosynthesis protein LarB [Deltaproteobacteria bacterium]
MDQKKLEELLHAIHKGKLSVEEGIHRLKNLPFEDIGEAMIDHHRSLRKGFPEVIFGEGKDAEQVITIMERMVEAQEDILITRITEEKAKAVLQHFPAAHYHQRARAITLQVSEGVLEGKEVILVVSAGTSDIPVAEEAAITATIMGNKVEAIYDVGVSGVHRLLDHRENLMEANVLIVVAGMEGALPSVVGGLVARPVIAVPTSVGYGTSFGGLTPLLAMLNSCASNVAVVNIDNGFGAGYIASLINRSKEV